MTQSNACRVAHFVLQKLSQRHGRKWLGARHPGYAHATPTEKANLLHNPESLLSRYQLKSVGRDAHAGLLGWLQNKYPLDLRNDIPTPREMLDYQCVGRRPVSWLEDPPEGAPHLFGRHADSLAFVLHDLEHGHKFFGDAILCRGQIVFFNTLRHTLPYLTDLTTDEVFSREMDYLMGDMNSHPLHMTKYFLATRLNALIRANKRHLFEPWLQELAKIWGLDEATSAALKRINNPQMETEADRQAISSFFV